MLFADVSGYTALSERLAGLGRVGAEQVTAAINDCFGRLIDVVLAAGGDVVRFGGDALFVAFTGDSRTERALAAAVAMQRAIRQMPTVPAPGGAVRLRQSIGVHKGTLHLHTWSGSWAEVVPFGLDVSEVLRCEAAAAAGEVVVSAAVAEHLLPSDRPASLQLRADGRSRVLRYSTDARAADASPDQSSADSTNSAAGERVLPPALRSALATRVGSVVDAEHRSSAIGFIAFSGLDTMASQPGSLDAVLGPVLDVLDRVGRDLGVTVLASDVAIDGLKLIVAAGVPEARGEHAERLSVALLAALDAAPASATVRGGAAAGVVFSGDVGHPLRRTYTVMGDVVNLAARLAAAAPTRALLVAEAIAAALPPSFACDWQAPLAVKGKRQRVRTAVVTHALTDSLTGSLRQPDDSVTFGSVAPGAAPPLLGRLSTIGELTTLLSANTIVQLVGPRGMGGTSTAAALADTWPGGHVVVAATVGDSAAPLRLIRRIVEAFGGPERWAVAAAVLGEVDGVRTPTRRQRQPSSLLADVLLDCWPPEALLVLDALDRADEASLAVLAVIATSLRIADVGRRLLVVGQRSVEHFGHHLVELTPLDDRSIGQLIVGAARRPLADAEIARLVGLAAGNPSFALELARIETGADLPPSMESLVAARLDRLDASQRRALRDLAVLGAEVPRHAAVALLDPDAAQLLDQLAHDGQLVSLHASPEPTFVFRDEGVRTVALAGMAAARARRLHVAMAEWLEQRPATNIDLVAAQWCASGQADGILRWAPLAGRRARRIGATHAATQWLRAALHAAEQSAATMAVRRRLGRELADVARLAGLLDVAADALAAVQRASTPDEAALVQVERAGNARQRGQNRAAAALLGRLTRRLPADPRLRATVAVERASQAMWRGDWPSALRLADRATTIAADSHDHASEHAAWNIVSQGRQALALDGVQHAAEQALRAARQSKDRRLIAIALGGLAMIDDNRGRWTAAQHGYRRSIELFDRCGDVVNAALLRTSIASIMVELGDIETAIEQAGAAARVLAAARAPADTVAVAESLAAQALLRRGGLDASEVVRQLEQQRSRTNVIRQADPELGCFQLARVIEMHLLAADSATARQLADELAALAPGYGEGHLLPAMARRLRAVALVAVGHADEGRALALHALAQAEAHQLDVERANVSSLLAALATLDGSTSAALPRLRDVARLGLVSQPLWLRDQTRSLGPPGPSPMITLSHVDVSG